MAKIFVDIEGNASEFIDEAKKAEAATDRLADEFADLGKAADRVEADLNGLGKAGTKLSSATKPLTKSIKETNDALKQLKPGANQATGSLTDFSRIVQDAPFGIIGIGNNIGPAIEGLQRLSAASGGAGGALKALGASLAGPGGLIFGVSIITSLLTVFSKELFGSGGAADSAKSALDRYSDSVQSLKENLKDAGAQIDFANRLGSLNLQIAGFGSTTGTELADLRQQSIAQDQSIANAVQYTKDLQKTYDDQEKTLELGSKERNDLVLAGLKDLREARAKEQEERNKQRIIFRQIELQKLKDKQETDNAAKAAADKAAADYEKYVKDTIANAKKLEQYLNNSTIRQFDAGISDDPRQPIAEQLKNALEFLQKVARDQRGFKLKINAVPQITLDTKAAGFRQNMAEEALKVTKALEEAISKLPKPRIIAQFDADIAAQRKKFEDLQDAIFGRDRYAGLDKIYADALRANEAISGLLVPAFDDLFDAIASGENPLQAFFKSIGQSIQDLLKKLVAAVVQALILTALLPGGGKSFGGFAGIFGKLLGGARANGGSVFGKTPYLIGERGPELFIPSGSGRVVPNGHLNTGLQGITGKGSDVFIPDVRVSGKDLRLVFARQGGYENRNV